ncbi:craniofacial development protein 2-like, partial [Octopus sinensis]|uniref:Craniofacial development protein 2-like n=1 Tax=Octopus sinensis TaxID=2607531 RepID=A0A6P7U143_9MOLL
TLNARTLGSLGRLEELGANAESHGIDIIAVQEHRFYHLDNILKYHQVGSYQLVTSSASKNTVNSTVGGIGFLLSSKASDTLLSIESISPRIMVLEIDGNPKTTLVCVYSPHNSSVADEIENFYTTLRSTIEQVPLHNFLVIAGDLNARLGPDETKFTFNSKTNRNGEMLKDFLEEFNLYTSNNSFMKPKGRLWTFESPLGDRAQIDYLIFRKKWRNSVKDSRSYSSFSSVGSDHRIVSATVKLSLRSSKKTKPHPIKMIDWEEVLSNPDMSKQFTIEVYNKFQSLSTSEIDAENIEEVYSSLIKSTEEVALATLPKGRVGARANLLIPQMSSKPETI